MEENKSIPLESMPFWETQIKLGPPGFLKIDRTGATISFDNLFTYVLVENPRMSAQEEEKVKEATKKAQDELKDLEKKQKDLEKKIENATYYVLIIIID